MLTILTMWIALFNFIVAPFSKVYKSNIIFLTLTMFFLRGAFQRCSLLRFYFFFELSILPVLFLILGWGYQPERFLAAIFIVFYTMLGSLPLFLIIIFISEESGSVSTFSMLRNLSDFKRVETLALIRAFLIKLPSYLVHMWLPKAHVEAPVTGSIILAGLILKLGGLGIILIRCMPLRQGGFFHMIISVSVFGGVMIAFIICRMTDIKVIIAYSSVAHISLVAVASVAHSRIRIPAVLLLLVCHGFTSPGIFAGANIIYERSHSRRTLLNKGLLNTIPALTTAWFLLIVLNFGGPFTANLLSEILLIRVAVFTSEFFMLILRGIAFFSLAYNLVLYASLNQGINSNSLFIHKTATREILILIRLSLPALLLLIGWQP